MNWLTILIGQIVGIFVREFLIWLFVLSKSLLEVALLSIPLKNERERQRDVFLNKLQAFEGSLCQLMIPLEAIVFCLNSRKRMYSRFQGHYNYNVKAQTVDLFGICSIKYSLLSGRLFVQGQLERVIKQNGQITKYTNPITWYSSTVKLIDYNRISVTYFITIDDELIEGNLLLEMKSNTLSGPINRTPIQGLIGLERCLEVS